jgi:pimeloyl-ACP methyl ester carboxylesterase
MTSSRVWIGGGTGAGKSSTARELAVRHGLRRFAIDSFWYAYEERWARPRKTPDEQWLETPPEAQAAEFEETSRRMMRYALDDFAELPDVPTVVEGPQILPDLVPPGDQAVFLDPTPEFQRSVLVPRPMPSSDPARALEARLAKDRIYADRVAALAREHGAPVLVMDGSRDLLADVESLLEIPEGGTELAASRRWENEAAAANIRAWLVSPEAPRAREHLRYTFACECGLRGCDGLVEMTIEEFDTASQVLAHD